MEACVRRNGFQHYSAVLDPQLSRRICRGFMKSMFRLCGCRHDRHLRAKIAAQGQGVVPVEECLEVETVSAAVVVHQGDFPFSPADRLAGRRNRRLHPRIAPTVTLSRSGAQRLETE